jgi:predicted lipoprotein with Yx(FWY)xxD motif
MNSKLFHTTNNSLAYLASVLMMGVVILSACMSAPVSAPAVVELPPKALSAPVKAPIASSASEATINVTTDAKLGKILVGDNGMTLYIFTKDGPNQSNCGPDCLSSWPPLLTQGNPKLGEGVDASLVGSATLSDSSKIVTYNKMPLYYFVGDTKAGDVTGQGAGNVWYVLSPEGKAVGSDAATEAVAPAAVNTPAEASLSVATDAKLGKILVGTNGMTVYMFTKDGPNQSNCNADCLAKWPPLLTQGNPTLGEGVDVALVGSASLPDGSKIVTYNKMPLYFFVKDAKPTDTTGQGVGNVWYVVSVDGKPVDEDPSIAAPASAAIVAPAIAAAPALVTSTTTAEPSISIVTDSKLGQILVGDQGMTLYILTKDAPDQSNCNAACLQKWPPLLTQGSPTLGAGLEPTMFGMATLPDGTKILTFNKMPLYYFVGDGKAGDTTGEGVGGVWFVISPLGKVVLLPAPIPTPKPKKDSGGGYSY